MEMQELFVSVLYNLEVFVNETLKPLCEKNEELKKHYFLLFSENTRSDFTFEQQEYAPVMMHAVAEHLATNLTSLKAVAVIAQSTSDPKNTQKMLKVILYFPMATYTRDYVISPKFEEHGEKWYREEELVFGFHNPFTLKGDEMIKHIPQLDFRMTYRCIAKRFKKQRLNYQKEHSDCGEIRPDEDQIEENSEEDGDLED